MLSGIGVQAIYGSKDFSFLDFKRHKESGFAVLSTNITKTFKLLESVTISA